MRYLIRFMFVLAMLGTLPQSASAQTGDADTASEPNLQEPAPSAEPVPEEPALQLKLDSAGVDVVPSPPRTADGYTLEEMDLRVKRARIGLISSTAVLVVGGVLLAVAAPNANLLTAEDVGLFAAGGAVAFCGLVGMITTGTLLRVRKRDRRRLQEADYGRPHRVQWDLAKSRVVF